jgi:hypothetical protein
MPLYLPTATIEPCTLAEAPSGSVFLQLGGGILIVGEVDQHDIAVRLTGEVPFTGVPFSRDERSNVRGIVAGQALFEVDAETAYRVRDANYATGDVVLGKGSTSIIGMQEDGGVFEVTILGDPQRGLEAGFTTWRLGVAGRDGQFCLLFDRTRAGKHKAANSNG